MCNWFAAGFANAEEPPDFEIGQFVWPSDDGSMVVPAFTGGGLLVNAHSEHLDAARTFALGFQLDPDNLDNSARFDGLYPAIDGWEPPSEGGAGHPAGVGL